MGAQVSFDPIAFVAQYSQFKEVPTATLFNYFNMAGKFCKNDGTGVVDDQEELTMLLNLIVAHLCQLFHPPHGHGPPPNLVGRITNASEGSVSVAVQMDVSQQGQFFNQTQYGAVYWQMTLPYRTMRYIRRRHQKTFNPWPIFRGGWWGP